MNYRVHLWSEAVAPITHTANTEGNEALIAREPVDTPAGKRWVPALSGNQLRNRLVRTPAALWLIDQLGLAGALSLKELNFFLHGGNLTESSGRDDTARIAEMQELFPLFRLLGGALPDQILSGSLRAWRGMLVCDENRPYLRANLPDGFDVPDAALKPAEHFVEGYQYTRGDAAKSPALYDPAVSDPDAKSNLMIFSGQQVIRGAAFVHGFHIPHGAAVEFGCLMHALDLWGDSGGAVGGMASKGHGRLDAYVLGGDGGVIDAAVDAYVAHVAATADRCRAWIMSTFRKPPKPEKPTRTRSGKGAAPDAI